MLILFIKVSSTLLLISFLFLLLFRKRKKSTSVLFSFLTLFLLSFIIFYAFEKSLSINLWVYLLILFITFLILFSLIRFWSIPGQVFFTSLVCFFIFVFSYFFKNLIYLPLFLKIFFVFALFVNLFAFFLLFLEVFSILNVVCREKNKRVFKWNRPPKSFYYPKVSLHIPVRSEPPSMVKVTLHNLSKLDWPNFEILVIDNGTQRPDLWQPVKRYCQKLGSRFKFFYLPNISGFKAGALNFALSRTASDAEIIGVIDSDYRVKKDFLKKTVPYFSDPDVAIVQTPQDYRRFRHSRYLTGCFYAYRYFFANIMNSANHDNAASFMGTMGLIRKDVLKKIGQWDKRIITEDIEIGIPIHCRDYKSIYIDHSFGKGFIPDEFRSFKKQRYRWCFGNVQVFKKHFRKLLPLFSRCLSLRQKISYFSEITIWFNTLLPSLILLLFYSVFLKNEYFLDYPFIALTLILPFLTYLFRRGFAFLWFMKIETKKRWKSIIDAFFSFLSLTWTMAWATFLGFLKRKDSFRRTSKFEHRISLKEGLNSVQWELSLGVVFFLIGIDWLLNSPSNLTQFFTSFTLFLYFLISFLPLWNLYLSTKDENRSNSSFMERNTT